ncbi:MAG: 2,3-bisphosphoglycerate-independent phosphoglycerate mutase [Deltaproteobacteria bacterium]|nr:2,3-bisphosphoglycerate-independent phosphoglycerate mutase [Deltaproteobacteria bacterium]
MACPKLKKISQAATDAPLLLVIMDGVGIGTGDAADAVTLARTPNLRRLKVEALATQLAAHGKAVGMPSSTDLGNSEIGHNALGAGRIFDQGAKLVKNAVDDGKLFAGATWRELTANCVREHTPLHFIGLLSDGNVHSHIDHLLAMIARADEDGVAEVYVHILLDGRDVPKTSAHLYIQRLEQCLQAFDGKAGRRYKIASGGGRMITTMDRYEADWTIVERGWRAHVLGDARPFASAITALETMRAEKPGAADQNLPPFVIVEDGKPVGTINDGAAVVVFNFRGDRMLELSRAFEDAAFAKFDRVRHPKVLYAAMMQYDGDTKRPKKFLVEPPEITCTLSELLCADGVSQLAISETQKFGHVTYFWNGNRTGKFSDELEHYIEVPSHAPPFDQRPEMRAPEITDAVITELARDRWRFLRLNFANGDMVGHTGNLQATVNAVAAVDTAVGRLQEAIAKKGGVLIVTADHGNADDMGERDADGNLQRDAAGQLIPKTAHSLNAVPFYLSLPPDLRAKITLAELKDPGLGNVAATIANLLGYETPEGFMPSLIERR